MSKIALRCVPPSLEVRPLYSLLPPLPLPVSTLPSYRKRTNDHDDSHHLLAPRGSFVRPGACPREAVPRRRRFFPVSHFFQAENVVAPPSAGARQRSLVWALDFLGALEAAHPLPRSMYGGDEENL